MDRVREAVENLLFAIEGNDSMREGLYDTPKRVEKMYDEIFAGYIMDPEDILGRTFEDPTSDQMVIVKDIEFFSHCEHHMVPFFGKVHIGYVPIDRVVGISKLARLVECFSRRLQIQERMTAQIADAIEEALNPLGVMVVVEAQHLCMSMRGIQRPDARTITSVQRGCFCEASKTGSKSEFLALIRA